MSAPETIESFFRNRYGWVDVAVVRRKDLDTGQPHSPDGWDVVVRIDGAYMNKKDAAFNAGLFEQRLMNLGLIKRIVTRSVEDLT